MEKQTIIVSGAHGNLGKAVVQHFHEEGFHVIGLVHHKKDHVSLSHYSEVKVDLTDEEATQSCIENILTQHGKIKAAILTAGGFAMGKLEKTSQSDLWGQYRLNFETAYHPARFLHKHLRNQGGGKLFFIGSEPGMDPSKGAGVVAYALAKSQLFQLAKIINADSSKTNVKAHVVVPATIDTPQNREAVPDADFSSWQSPSDIAGVIGKYMDKSEDSPLSIVVNNEL